MKPTDSARQVLPNAIFELPYQGANEMILADVDNRDLLNNLIPAIASDLSTTKKKR